MCMIRANARAGNEVRRLPGAAIVPNHVRSQFGWSVAYHPIFPFSLTQIYRPGRIPLVRVGAIIRCQMTPLIGPIGKFCMRLLHIADVHLGRPFRWLGRERGSARRAELRATLGRAVALARERKVDALCIAGDLYERENALPAVGELLRETFAALENTPVLIAPGNHDYYSPGCLYDQTVWPANVHIFRQPALTPVRVADGVVWGLAFVGPERRASPLSGAVRPSSEREVVLCHAEVVESGGSSLFGPLEPSALATAGFRFALLGHVHRGQVDEARRFAYPGSLEPLDPREEGPRWALQIDVTGDGVTIEQIPIARRRAIQVELDVSEIRTRDDWERALAEWSPAWLDATVKLRLVGTLRGELSSRPEFIADSLADYDVDLEMLARPEEDLRMLARQQTTLGAFIRATQERIDGASDPAERIHWEDVLAVGLAAFRGQEVTLR